ncbi:MAG: hypothetical protein KDI59_00695 [Xanthomonadales bacterium]|jgi:hypothetical protein|nr:hypothetical protein [Xanthomonadales bacterium]
MKKLIFALLLIFCYLSVSAQQGPVAPCVDCESLSKRTEPHNGMWYNPDQSGSGMTLDVQDGKLFGVVFGYDDDGKSRWWTFVNDLSPSNEPNIMWTLNADLMQFENGNSFNNDYIFPTQTNYEGQISLKFTQKNHALYSINGGEEQNIVPIIFGVTKSRDFPEQTSYLIPELEGVWTFVYQYNESHPDVPPEPYNIFSEAVVISSKNIGDITQDGIIDIGFSVSRYDFFPNSHHIGFIYCYVTEESNEVVGPSCEFLDTRGLLGDIEIKPVYKMKLGGIGAFRLFGEDVGGHTFEGIRINAKDY